MTNLLTTIPSPGSVSTVLELFDVPIAVAGSSPAESSAVPTDPLAITMIVLGVMFLGMLMTYSIRARIARRANQRPTGRDMIESIKNRAGVAQGDPEVARAAMLDESQRLAAAMDNKARRLEMLLDEADRAISDLTNLREQVRLLVDRSRPKREVTGRRTEVKAAATSDHRATIESAKAEIAQLMPEIDTLTAPADPLTESVYALSDAGRSTIDIARELDEQTGKIELILALRDQ